MKLFIVNTYATSLHCVIWDSDNQLQKKDWVIIDAFVMTYNSTVHRVHSRTPHQALFGWKMRKQRGKQRQQLGQRQRQQRE